VLKPGKFLGGKLMDHLRESLDLAEKQTREEMGRLNEVLKHILLARQFLDSETPVPDEPEEEAQEAYTGPMEPPSELQEQYNTRYSKGTTSNCIVNVLGRTDKPIDSRKVHDELKSGGWTTSSKDSLMAVRNALVRLSKNQDIKTEKINGILHYSQKPIKELV